MSESLPARVDDAGDASLVWTESLCNVEPHDTIVVLGGPGTGKTLLLAACVVRLWRAGRRPLVVVADAAAQQAFREALGAAGAPEGCPEVCATLAQHAARWLRAGSTSLGISPHLTVGGHGATRRNVEDAAGGLFDMSWESVASCRDGNLDLPYLSRPQALLDEAAVLFDLLSRSCVTPGEFEEGCLRGLGAFYGEEVERAASLLADPDVVRRASRRSRTALQASRDALVQQRRAERELARLLVDLFQAYRAAARTAALRSADDVVAAFLDWVQQDAAAARAVAREIDVLIVDDAEDAEPALPRILGALRGVREFAVIAAGSESARIAGLGGRRSLLGALSDARRIVLPPRAPGAAPIVARCADEEAELCWLQGHVESLLTHGCAPEDIAVLTRTQESAGVYAAALRRAGIPTAWPSTVFARPNDVADLLALAAILEDPYDEAHLMRVLSSPLVGLSDKSLWLLCRDRDVQEMLPLDAPVDGRLGGADSVRALAANVYENRVDDRLPQAARASLGSLRDGLESWRRELAGLPLAARLAHLAEAAGFCEAWQTADAWERQRAEADLRRLCAAAAAAESAGATGASQLEEFLEQCVLTPAPAAPSTGAVAVEAIGACKGLRWRHVVVAGVAWERFPRIYIPRALAFSRTYGLLVRENVAAGAGQTAKYAWYYAKFGAKELYLAEERRILRYALSRGDATSAASGFGRPPGWAADHDLLADLEGRTCGD